MITDELALYREAIENGFPGLVVDSIGLAGEGMDNLALDINSEYVFRFPKLEEAAAKIELEAVLLPVLQQSLDVRIPSPEFGGTDPGTGLTFSGYRRIEGVPLEPEVLLDLAHPSPDRLLRKLRFFHRANAVGNVLIGFHRDDPELVEDSIAALKRQVEADGS